MDVTPEIGVAVLRFIRAVILRNREKRRKKRIWVRSWLARRERESVYHRLMQELALEDQFEFRKFLRMTSVQFEELLGLVSPLITKQDTNMRRAVSAGERLALTLRYLATGESQASLGYQFRVSHNLVSSIIPECCRALYEVLHDRVMKLPSTVDEWLQVASEFYRQWNFPHCIGAVDGKRVLICKPSNSGSEFYDYKGHFSTIMMALVSADLKFLYVDVGASGRASDGGVWDRCSLKQGLEGHCLNIPATATIPFSQRQVPFVIVGDEAFPLKTYLMKPFPGREITMEKRIFNYRLSRARRVSENAFGVFSARFLVFKSAINTTRDNVKAIVLAGVVLHNFLLETSRSTYAPPEMLDREDTERGRFIEGQWRQQGHVLAGLEAVGRGHSNDARNIRDSLLEYFNNEGTVSWQDQLVDYH